MNSNDPMRTFRDPLMAQLDQVKSERRQAEPDPRPAPATSRRPHLLFAAGLALLTLGGYAGYSIYVAQRQIELLSQELTASRQHLAQVGGELRESRQQIEELNQGLDQSRQQLVRQDRELNRTQGLYQGIRSEQEVQTRELQTLHTKKADVAAVDRLQVETSSLKGQIESTDGRLAETRTQVAGIDSRTRRQEDAINRNRAEIDTVRVAAERNTTELGELRRSLEREYYNFELQEGGGYMKVLNVSLNLRKTDFERRQCDLYLLADGKVIRKKDQPINEPIYFYVEGKDKPYEVVITRVDRKLVVGYLSIPKA